ncbi:universal stress protein UspA [Desulfuromonas versatilis]|uniref:Universal stress protein UspA n=1 Tax=Desulfuromonas versatilis TaxID=2802975 RepID=A0ABM8HS28_9BACT|nr:universal stress protein [Desulfuromonas versatilis]BCR03261.1 universal stress protein UspA [Desulfuromonas versatilis]
MEPKILIPVDGSETCKRTVEQVIAVRERFPRRLTLLHVVDMDKLAYRMIPDFQVEMVRENARKAGAAILRQRTEPLTQAGFEIDQRLEFGAPRQVIPRIANEEGFGLLVIGRHTGTGEIRDVLFGSVANYVLHNVKCPVLLF